MRRRKLRPLPHERVRKPDGHQLRREGESVPLSNYWVRRIKAGEVEEVQPRPKAPSESAKKPGNKTAGEAAKE